MENNKPWLKAKLLAEAVNELTKLTNENFKRGDAVKFQNGEDICVGIVTQVKENGIITVTYLIKGYSNNWNGKELFIWDVIDKMES